MENKAQAPILIIDDEETARQTIRRMLRTPTPI